ncbi:PDDEXK nuclease domain-containing protein [Singulisphaera sp. PoT]|uniref:PDDEXK nuclease domain-containing protein n=1 Tax=Singulisphaera sp. PoT TaxID=3411797 RepID=UPI003BF53A8C
MQVNVNYYQRELTAPDENPPIGIVLCTDKSEAVVRYALPEGNRQIFATRYKLHLPTEAELAAELQRERREIELTRSLDADPGASNAYRAARLIDTQGKAAEAVEAYRAFLKEYPDAEAAGVAKSRLKVLTGSEE